MRRRQALISGAAAFTTAIALPSRANPPIRLGYGARVPWLPWAIAEQENLFAKHGVDVELRWYDSPNRAANDLRLGSLDVNCASFADAIIDQARSLYGCAIVAVLANSAGADQIIADQSVISVRALQGRRLALQEGSISDYFLQRVVEDYGLSRLSFDIINMEAQAAATSFAIGLYDAVCVYSPYNQVALQRASSRILIDSSAYPGVVVDVLVASDGMINPRADQMQRLLNVWFDCLAFLRNNPDRAYSIMASPSGLTAAQVQTVVAGTRLFSVSDNLVAFLRGGQANSLSYSADLLAEFLQFRGQLNRLPPLHRLLESRFIEEYARLTNTSL